MKYLFYDVECATCSPNAVLYSFGYVLTDENLKVLKRDEILINPNIAREKWQYHVVRKIAGKDIFKRIKDKPYLKRVYQSIKEMLEESDTITLGFSVLNDVRYFLADVKRCNLDPFSVKSFDVQEIYKQYSGTSDTKSLKTIATLLDINLENINLHRPDEDSYVTMKVFEKICIGLELTPDKLLELACDSFVDSKLYLKNKNSEKIIDNLGREVNFENYSKSALTKWYNKNLDKLLRDYPKSNKKVISFSDSFKKDSFFLTFIKMILDSNFFITDKIGSSDFYVSLHDKSSTDCWYDENEIAIKTKRINIIELLEVIRNSKSKLQ